MAPSPFHRRGEVSVEVRAISIADRPSSSQQRPTPTSKPNSARISNGGQSSIDPQSQRIPYASKGKWKETTEHAPVDSDEEYLGFRRTTVDATVISVPAENGLGRKEPPTFSQTKAKKRVGQNGPNSDSNFTLLSTKDDARHTTTSGTSSRISPTQTLNVSNKQTIRHATPPQWSPDYIPPQSIYDRTPPTPPPLPDDWQPWYLIYAPEVAWAKLDTKENVVLRQDIDHLSEGSQGRTSASRTTPTSKAGLSRTPSKNRMRMVPAGHRDRSRSRRATVDAGDEPDHSRSGDKARSMSVEEEEQDSADSSVEVTSASSSGSSNSDHEETDGTDSEVEELLAFKKATRRFAEIRYPDSRTAPTTSLVIECKRRKLLLEESLPDTYGPRHASRLSRTIIDAAKPGSGPRAVARKSFARAIGARLLAKKRVRSHDRMSVLEL